MLLELPETHFDGSQVLKPRSPKMRFEGFLKRILQVRRFSDPDPQHAFRGPDSLKHIRKFSGFQSLTFKMRLEGCQKRISKVYRLYAPEPATIPNKKFRAWGRPAQGCWRKICARSAEAHVFLALWTLPRLTFQTRSCIFEGFPQFAPAQVFWGQSPCLCRRQGRARTKQYQTRLCLL